MSARSPFASLARVSAARGAVPVLAAAIVAGAAGYLIGVVVPSAVSPSDYATFSLVWSAQFLVVAALSGVQQEVGRASSPGRAAYGAVPTGDLHVALRFARTLAGVVAVITVALSVVLVWRGVLPGSSVFPLTVAAVAFGVVAVLTGLLYGLGRTGVVAVAVGCEWLARCVLVVLTLAVGAPLTTLLWAIALPTLLAPLVLIPLLRDALRDDVRLDVAAGTLARNALVAVATCVASGVLISGFPVVMTGLTDAARDPHLPGINLAIMLIRSPIVVAVVALQAFLVVRFRDAGDRAVSVMWRLQAGLLALTAVGTVAGAAIAPPVLGVFGASYRLSAEFVAGLVLASGLLGCLCVGGALALARSRHGVYLAGWAVAAVSSVVTLLLPGSLETKVVVALLVAPLLGLAVQAGVLRRAS